MRILGMVSFAGGALGEPFSAVLANALRIEIAKARIGQGIGTVTPRSGPFVQLLLRGGRLLFRRSRPESWTRPMSEEISRRFFCRVALALPLFFVAQRQPVAEATPACPSDKPMPEETEGTYYKPRSPERRSLLEPGIRRAAPGSFWFGDDQGLRSGVASGTRFLARQCRRRIR